MVVLFREPCKAAEIGSSGPLYVIALIIFGRLARPASRYGEGEKDLWSHLQIGFPQGASRSESEVPVLNLMASLGTMNVTLP